MDFTDLLEKFIPNYHSNQQVLELDILTKWYEDEPLDRDDVSWIISLGDQKDVAMYYQSITEQLAIEAMEHTQRIMSYVNTKLQNVYDDSTLGDVPMLQKMLKDFL